MAWLGAQAPLQPLMSFASLLVSVFSCPIAGGLYVKREEIDVYVCPEHQFPPGGWFHPLRKPEVGSGRNLIFIWH